MAINRHRVQPTPIPISEGDVRRLVSTTGGGGSGSSLKLFVGTTPPASPQTNDLWVDGGSATTSILPRIHVGTSAMVSPTVNDLWVDTN